MYESELALRLTPYVAGEQPKNRKFIKLNTNENPYPPSPRVAEVLRSFDAASLRLYPDMDATALREAISAVEGVPADWMFCGNGSDEVLAFCVCGVFRGQNRRHSGGDVLVLSSLCEFVRRKSRFCADEARFFGGCGWSAPFLPHCLGEPERPDRHGAPAECAARFGGIHARLRRSAAD